MKPALFAASGALAVVNLAFVIINALRGHWLFVAVSSLATLIAAGSATGFWPWLLRQNPRCTTCAHRKLCHDRTMGCLADGDGSLGICTCEKFSEVFVGASFPVPVPMDAWKQHAATVHAQIAQLAQLKHGVVAKSGKTRAQTEPIIAYRAWRVRLAGPNSPRLWPINAEFCGEGYAPRKRMEADSTEGGRGIHAFVEPASILQNYGAEQGLVFGRVALWGVVEKHASGYRAQYAYPQMFYRTPGSDLDALANAWGVELDLPPDAISEHYEKQREVQAYIAFDDAWSTHIEISRASRDSVPMIDANECYERHTKARSEYGQFRLQHNVANIDPRIFLPARSR